MLKKNDIIHADIVSMSSEGFGIAKYSDNELHDFVVFVKGAATGEKADVRIIKILTSYAIAITERIYTPSPLRITPRCAAAGRCGGCAFGHIKYEEELRIKKNEVTSLLRRALGTDICAINDVVPSPQIYRYRNKAQMPLSPLGKFGMYAKRSHTVITADSCALNDESFDSVQKAVEKYIDECRVSAYDETTGKGLIRHLYMRRAHTTKQIMLVLVVSDADIPYRDKLISAARSVPGMTSIYLNVNNAKTNVILGHKYIHIWGKREIQDQLCGLKFTIHPNSFYQINSPQTEQMLKWIKDHAQITKTDTVLDLYCGIGTIGLSLADIAGYIIGIESVPQAVDNARDNAAANSIFNAEFHCADAENASEILKGIGRRPEVIVVDPPRKGLGPHAVEFIIRQMPRTLIYISCNPSTLARDLTQLADKGRYKISAVQPFDMFPRTSHVETVVCLTRTEQQ